MRVLALVVVLLAGATLVRGAWASAAVYPQGTFVRPSEEKVLVVWDEAHETEHLVCALTLKGDADSFGVLLATEALPTIAKETDAAIDRFARLFTPPGGSEALARAQVGDFEAVSVKASEERLLDDWLVKNHFADKPSMRAWAKGYADKGFYLTAVRSTAKGAGDRKLEVPAIRLSFKTHAPVLPYAEPAVDTADETAYTTRYNPHQPYRSYSYGMRPFDVYVVAARQMQAVSAQTTAGPNVTDALRASSDAIQEALGDTKSWGFDPKARAAWVVTHLSENVWSRTIGTDLGLQTYDLPKPRPGPGVTEADDRPDGPTFPPSSMEWLADAPGQNGPASHHKKLLHVGALALLLLVAAAAGYAALSEQRRAS